MAMTGVIQKVPGNRPAPSLQCSNPRSKRRTYLEENAAAATISLNATDMNALHDALAANKIAGPRYGETMMSLVDR